VKEERLLQLQRFCFLLVVALLPLNSLSVVFPLNILGGGFANKASFYPAFAGMALAIYGEIRWGGIFAALRTVRTYWGVSLSVILLSTVTGLWNYPYYAAIKLPELGRLPGCWRQSALSRRSTLQRQSISACASSRTTC
jgi:hypothetical protein